MATRSPTSAPSWRDDQIYGGILRGRETALLWYPTATSTGRVLACWGRLQRWRRRDVRRQAARRQIAAAAAVVDACIRARPQPSQGWPRTGARSPSITAPGLIGSRGGRLRRGATTVRYRCRIQPAGCLSFHFAGAHQSQTARQRRHSMPIGPHRMLSDAERRHLHIRATS
jgi:hypothetical protein